MEMHREIGGDILKIGIATFNLMILKAVSKESTGKQYCLKNNIVVYVIGFFLFCLCLVVLKLDAELSLALVLFFKKKLLILHSINHGYFYKHGKI